MLSAPNEFNKYINSPNIFINYVNSRENMKKKIIELTSRFKSQAEYFISGSPKMIKSVKKELEVNGAKKIKNDPFIGY